MTQEQNTLSFEKVLAALQRGDLSLEGEFVHGHNYTFLIQVQNQEESIRAVYKPQKGEQPLWDFPDDTLAHREASAYLVSQALGWNFVPPTVFREDGPYGPGSVQFFIDHDPNYHYFNLRDEDFQRLPPVVLFDLLINNADRKGSHMLFGPEKELWLIDHGLCFNVDEKLRTVIWDFAGQPIPQDLRDDLVTFKDALGSPSEWVSAVEEHLASNEISALQARAERLIKMDYFPYPPQDRRAYPFPPL